LQDRKVRRGPKVRKENPVRLGLPGHQDLLARLDRVGRLVNQGIVGQPAFLVPPVQKVNRAAQARRSACKFKIAVQEDDVWLHVPMMNLQWAELAAVARDPRWMRTAFIVSPWVPYPMR